MRHRELEEEVKRMEADSTQATTGKEPAKGEVRETQVQSSPDEKDPSKMV